MFGRFSINARPIIAMTAAERGYQIRKRNETEIKYSSFLSFSFTL